MNWREDCIQQFSQPFKSTADVVQAVAKITAGCGFEYCSYVLRKPFPIFRPADIWSSTYPDHWLEHYFSHDYLSIDPLLARLAKTQLPIVWSEGSIQQEPSFWEEARHHGVRHGWAISTRGAFSTGMLSLARSAEQVTSEELKEYEPRLVWLSHVAHSAINNLELRKVYPGPSQELSSREREVLRWTASGKTAGEIGLILGVSERTVNFHITGALVKLDAVNKLQAVVTAIVLGLLF